jgi:hypothetical protein
MCARATLLWYFLASSAAVCVVGKATADIMSNLFEDGVPGYDTGPGITVQSRLHPELQPLGVREGAFKFMPNLEEGVGYASNAVSGPARHGSWEILTAPSLTIGSDWAQDAFGAAFALRDTRFLSLPSENRLDATATLGGRIDMGDSHLTLAAVHLLQHEDRSQVGTIASDRPIAFQIDEVRASYEMNEGRWNVVPSLRLSNWSYAATTILGVPASQSYRDRMMAEGALTLRYQWAPLRNIVFVLRALGQDYLHTPAGVASPDSVSYQALAGFDYDDDSVWRWRLLVGEESRHFASTQYATQNTLIAEAGVTWSPSGMTTISASLSRDTQDAAQEGVSGLVYSSARLTIDRECLRNLLLRASIALQRADYFQGGHQTGTSAGIGMTWLVNRSMQLVFTYDQSDLRGSKVPTEALATGYSRGIGMVTLRLSL